MYNNSILRILKGKTPGTEGSFEGRDGWQGKEGGIWYGRF